MGVGPLLSWRGRASTDLALRFTIPAAAAALMLAALALAGVRNVGAMVALGLAAFLATSTGAELLRHVSATARLLRVGPARAGLAAWEREPRLVGGLVAHLGIALAAVAITASSSFGQQAEVALSPGSSASFAGYRLTYLDRRVLVEPQREVLVADVAVTRDGRAMGHVTPSLNLYPGASEPIGTPSIRYGVVADLYASVLSFDGTGPRAVFRFFRNPGVLWLWVGGAVVVLGGLMALRRPTRIPPVPKVAPVGVPAREAVPA
jgi:cytochrome c-type biogenesis protein CcmF